MKKLTLIVLALGLLIPINASAYTTFIALDTSVIADGLTGIEVDLVSPGATFFPPGGPFAFSDGSNYSFVSTSFLNLGSPAVSMAVSPPSTTFDEVGVLLYYQNDTMAVPDLLSAVIGSTVVTANYDLTKTLDFTSYSGGFTAPDVGDLYTISQVPLPSAIFLLAPGLLALFGLRRRVAK